MNRQEFLSLRREETPKTLRLLEMYPEGMRDLKPADKTRTALELANIFLNEERANRAFVDGVPAVNMQKRPGTIAETISALQDAFHDLDTAVERMADDDWNRPTDFFGRTIPLGKALVIMLLDHIHHRGQFTVYARLAGGRVPRIYGPSADEPMG